VDGEKNCMTRMDIMKHEICSDLEAILDNGANFDNRGDILPAMGKD
jgi:hypothetical protein